MPIHLTAPGLWCPALVLAGLLSVSGCESSPRRDHRLSGGLAQGRREPAPALAPEDREAVARCLDGVSLADGVRVRPDGVGGLHLVTVDEALAELGVVAGEDGKLRDRGGREVRFWRNPLSGRGTPWSNQEALAVSDEYKGLKKRYTVIEFDYYPGQEKGGPPPPMPCSAAR